VLSWGNQESIIKAIEMMDFKASIEKILNKKELFFNKDYTRGSHSIKLKLKLKKVSYPKNDKNDSITPTLRLLPSANLKTSIDRRNKDGIIYVRENDSLLKAISKMVQHDISQIPVLNKKRTSALGIISWKRIGTYLGFYEKDVSTSLVKDCMEKVEVLPIDTSLFEAVAIILNGNTVLVEDDEKIINGIVTSKNISEQFIAMAKPFLLLEQIEKLIRELLDAKLTRDDIMKTLDPTKMSKTFTDLSSLSFGNYPLIIKDEENFKKLGFNVSREVFVNSIINAGDIRNKVMHFNPSQNEVNYIPQLEGTLRLLKAIINPLNK